MSSREILEEDSDDDGLTGAGMDKLVDEGVPHPKHQEELQLSFNFHVSGNCLSTAVSVETRSPV